MSQQDTPHDLQHELRNAQTEPWLPIESKLVGWSLGIGITLLIVLTIVNVHAPATF